MLPESETDYLYKHWAAAAAKRVYQLLKGQAQL